ncbi:hypothetical protein Scep_001986 [Stephania cephalantha]|uniref:Uncharacterized protein n=1 Tax=Stephania cephalantha TaxID=152367 RepID=A0AAP0Q499_9MAGN
MPKRNSNNRAQQTLNPRTGRTPICDIHHKTRIDSRLSEVSESKRTSEMREALFKEVFGDDKRRRVQTYGTRTSHTDVFGHGSSKVQIDVEMQSLHNQLIETQEQLRLQREAQ